MTKSKSKPKTAPRRDPTEREAKRMAEAAERVRNRKPSPGVSSDETPGRQQIAAAHSDQAGWDAHLRDAFGTASHDFAGQTLLQLCGVMQPDQSKHIAAAQINAALAAVHGIAPRDEAEAMLAAEMAGTHAVAMTMLRRAHSAQTVDGLREYGNLASKLLRTFTAQTEALAKLRRGGEQTVRVEHVHVHEGGQAIVGNVSHMGGGGSDGNCGQSHAPNRVEALEYAPSTPVRGSDPFGDALRRAGLEGQEAVPHARRRKRHRRA